MTTSSTDAPTEPITVARPADDIQWEPPNKTIPLPRAILDLPLRPTKMLTDLGPEYQDDAREVNMVPGIERTRGGRLWSVWISGGDEDTGFALAATSDDNGKSWSKPCLAIDPVDPPGARQRAISVNAWLDPSNRLWIFYDQALDYYDGRSGVWAVVCDDPDQAEPQWSEPRRIWHGSLLNKPTVLSTGEWLLPISLWERAIPKGSRLEDAHHDLDHLRGINIFRSTDSGATFERLSHVSVASIGVKWDFDEPLIVERKDGTLWMPIRTRHGILATTSNDRGGTWATPAGASFNGTNARFYVRRLKSGRILLVKNGRNVNEYPGLFKRVDMTAFLSEDEGETWSEGFVLDERDGLSYPDGTEGPDGQIYVTYDWNRYAVPGKNVAEILLATFTEADILAGKIVSKDGALRQIINRANPVR